MCRWSIGITQWLSAELADAAAQFDALATEARAAHDPVWQEEGLRGLARVLTYHGDVSGACAAARAAIDTAAQLTGFQRALCLGALTDALLAAGDVPAAAAASDAASRAGVRSDGLMATANPLARVALAQGDLGAAQRWADDAVTAATGAYRIGFLATRIRVAIATDDIEQARRDAHDALALIAQTKAYLTLPDVIECLATLATGSGDHQVAARLLGAAASVRERTGQVRFIIYDADYTTSMTALRKAMDHHDLDTAWTEGAALSTDDAIAWARRGRGPRRRPPSGWASLTPTERDVVRLIGEGLANKQIATRLFISPRTVETHIRHIHTKLGVTSRVQLAHQAANHA